MGKLRLLTVDQLQSGMVLGRTIFGSNGQVLLKQGVTISEGYIKFLKAHLIDTVYIADGGVMVKDVISDETRVQALNATREVLSQVKKGASLQLDRVNQVLISIIDELLLQDDVMINLVDIRSFSEDLFCHSINVTILASIMGIELAYPKKQLASLAVGALFHDIGKILLPEEDARAEHPKLGSDFLQKSRKVEPAVISAVLQHHERWDGQGYPRRLRETQIHEYARIIGIADKFDRLSANNRYPMEEVVEYLMAMSGHEFDPKITRTFINSVSFFPAGTRVVLNTGEVGVVIRANKGFPTRPVVLIEENVFGGTVDPGYEVDLVARTTYFIKHKLDDQSQSGAHHEAK